ncbi:MAG: dynamin family protein [Armatimonadetes bacterium]|nr:dynamin family protein [Armatimonadota bacterium]
MNGEDRIAVQFYNETRLKGARAIRDLADLAEERKDTITHESVTTPRAQILREAARALEDNEFTIAVVGEFSRGKSSLINALLEWPELLPTAIEPSTAAITVLHHAQDPLARVTYTDGTVVDAVPMEDLPKYVVGEDLDGRKASRTSTRRLSKLKTQEEIESISFSEIGKEIAQQLKAPGRKPVKFVDVCIPSPFLKDGIILVDTPGIGSINPEHGQATREYISKADAVIFLINTDPVISDSECNFLMFLEDYVNQFVFAVTKIDRFSEEERTQSMQYTHRIIEEYAGIENPPLYPVSSKLALEARSTGDREKLDQSGFPDFRQGLEHYLIRERGRHILHTTSRDVRLHLNDILNSVEAEMKHLFLSSEEMQQRSGAMQKGLRDAQYVRQAICRDLDKAINNSEQMICGDVDWLRVQASLKTQVADEIESYTWGELQRSNELIPLFVKSQLHEILSDTLTRVSESLATVRSDAVEWAMETLAKLGHETGYEVGATRERAEWEISFQTRSNTFKRNLQKVGTMTVGSSIALTVAGVFLFGGIGAIAMIGGLLLGGGSAPFMLKRTKSQLGKEVNGALGTLLDQLLDDLKREIAADLGHFREEITSLLDSAVSNVSETLQRMETEHTSTGFDGTQRKGELDAQLARANKIDDDLNRLRFFAGYVAGEEVRALSGD